MILRTHIPEPPLDRFVAGFVYYEGYRPDHLIDRFLPDGNVELIIDLGEEPKYVYDNETLRKIQTCRRVWASGVRSEPISIFSGNGAAMLIVNFRKGAAHPFFPVPMDEVADRVVGADLLWGGLFEELRERLLAADGIKRRFRIAEQFLLANFRSKLEINPCVEYAVGRIKDEPAGINLGRLNREIGYSQKHFISMFKKQVGLTPKKYLRINRFQKALGEIERSGKIDWARIAQKCGFYDQAHFIADFKRFSEFTPEVYLKKKNHLVNYVPVG